MDTETRLSIPKRAARIDIGRRPPLARMHLGMQVAYVVNAKKKRKIQRVRCGKIKCYNRSNRVGTTVLRLQRTWLIESQ
ncbi:hypothetical protein PM082_000285 [Marasmius tenuissimus]|nr:hypothetical protein PM082_000285 [Marasmius tenuissimus]